MAGAGRWTLANAVWLRIVAGVLGVIVMLWGADVSVSRLFWSFVLIGALLALIQVLVGTGRSAAPPGDRDDTTTEPPEDTVPSAHHRRGIDTARAGPPTREEGDPRRSSTRDRSPE